MEIITSPTNKTVKHIRSLLNKKGRDFACAFLVEGAKFVVEVSPEWNILHIIMSKTYAESFGGSVGTGFARPLINPIIVTDRIFNSLSDATTPQGIMAAVAQKTFTIEDIIKGNTNPLIFILEDLNDPGNLGTILRSCHGLGASGIILSQNCADIFSPKTIRASAGSIFHLPFAITNLNEAAKALKKQNIPLYATLPNADKNIYDLNLKNPAAFILGNEHNGLKPETIALADYKIKIPTLCESLNVSAACAILAYETQRQRTKT